MSAFIKQYCVFALLRQRARHLRIIYVVKRRKKNTLFYRDCFGFRSRLFLRLPLPSKPHTPTLSFAKEEYKKWEDTSLLQWWLSVGVGFFLKQHPCCSIPDEKRKEDLSLTDRPFRTLQRSGRGQIYSALFFANFGAYVWDCCALYIYGAWKGPIVT